MARLRGAALVLGSATPLRLRLYPNGSEVEGTNWTRVAMTERGGVAVSSASQVVDMASSSERIGLLGSSC